MATYKTQQGFTAMELMIAVAVIGILVAIALPNYQDYVRRTKRADMMSEMQTLAKKVEARKLAAGRSRSTITVTDLNKPYPDSSRPTYSVEVFIRPATGLPKDTSVEKWVIRATPTARTQVQDGVLTLYYNGSKCRQSKCGMGNEWNTE